MVFIGERIIVQRSPKPKKKTTFGGQVKIKVTGTDRRIAVTVRDSTECSFGLLLMSSYLQKDLFLIIK